MRNDLTANFLAAMAANGRAPIQLLVFHFDTFGDVYLSDRDITVDGKLYKGLVEDWGELSTSGGNDSVSGTMEMSLSIWNGGDIPFSTYFLSEEPMNTFVDVYQTFEGLAPEDVAVVGNFVMQDPIRFSEASRLLNIDLVTTNMRYVAQVGSLLSLKQFPYALDADVNKSIDLIVGDAGRVKCLCCKKPPVATLDGSIVRSTISIEVSENLDTLGFAAAGFIQINEELIVYSSRTSNTFIASQRGYTTIPESHSHGDEVIQANTNTDYIVGQYPLGGVSSVFAGDSLVEQPYSVVTNENGNGVILLRFNSQPLAREVQPASDATVYFDTTESDNTAVSPWNAYSENFKTEGAVIKHPSNKLLSIANRLDSISERATGDLVGVFLEVVSWSSKAYTSGYYSVVVDGLGEVGRLTRPDDAATLTLTADVDIDHPHIHNTGGVHDHGKTDPEYDSDQATHDHAYNDATIPPQSLYGATNNFIATYSLGGELTPITKYQTIALPQEAGRNILSRSLQIGGTSWGSVHIEIYATAANQYTVRTVLIGVIAGSISSDSRSAVFDLPLNVVQQFGSGLRLIFDYYNVDVQNSSGGIKPNSAQVTECRIESMFVDQAAQTDGKDPFIGTAIDPFNLGSIWQQSKDTLGKGIKDEEDVEELATDNREVEVIDSTLYTQSFTDQFDLLDFGVDINWGWLQNKRMSVQYVGSDTDLETYVTWCQIKVEYRKYTYRSSDDISCLATGHSSVGSRPDQVIQYLLHNKAGVPLDKLGSVWRSIPVWDDLDVWNDLDVWQDEGQVAGVPAGAYFEEAAAWFNFNSYLLDGALSGSLSVKDAVTQLTLQTRSRLLWQNGKAKLVVLRKSEDWNIAKALQTDIIQLRSLAVEKTLSADIVNKIDLFYDLDRLSDISGKDAYRASASEEDVTSISKNGEKKQDDLFLFDMIRRGHMATDIADYYIWLYGETRSLYSLTTYLPNFDVEKSDYITISSTGFERLNDLPVTVNDTRRLFGSGKNHIINSFRVQGESIRHKNFLIAEYDTVVVSDNLSIDFGFDLDFDDIVNVSDTILVTEGKFFDDSVTVSDSFIAFAQYSPCLVEVVLATDILTAELSVVLSDVVNINDDLFVAQELCFGACGFGAPNCIGPVFGSKTTHRGFGDEYPLITDELMVSDTTNLVEDVLVEDELLFSDGFGCPSGLGSGFGLSPFGDKHCTIN